MIKPGSLCYIVNASPDVNGMFVVAVRYVGDFLVRTDVSEFRHGFFGLRKGQSIHKTWVPDAWECSLPRDPSATACITASCLRPINDPDADVRDIEAAKEKEKQ
jgi:hypothetical protein